MDNSALYQFNQSINQSVNCDATATRNEHVHFSARLHDVAANLNGGIGAGEVDRLWRHCLLLFSRISVDQ